MQDMLVRLYALPSFESERLRLQSEGVICRRAESYERLILLQFVRERWPDWLDEAAASFAHLPPTMFIAHAGDEVLGFATFHASRPNVFGPMGVDEYARLHGVGKVLLWQSLSAMAAEGYGYAIIAGDGPFEFFAGTVGATAIEGSEPGIYQNRLRAEAA